MKKKLMMVAVLLGALTLGACVDDNESASVTAVREAKAKQLTALATKAEAEAEAALISANAEKAYKEALVKYQEALTKNMDAQTEQVQEEIRQSKEQFDAEMETIKAEYERRMWEAKRNAIIAEQEFLDKAETRLQALYLAYSQAAEQLSELKKQKAGEEYNLARLEAYALNIDEYIAQQTAEYEAQIKEKEAAIAAWQEYGGLDKSKLNAQLESLKQEKYTAFAALDAAKTENATAEEVAEELLALYDWESSEASTVKAVAAIQKYYTANYVSDRYYLGNVQNEARRIIEKAKELELIPSYITLYSEDFGYGTFYYISEQYYLGVYMEDELLPCVAPITTSNVALSESKPYLTVPSYSISNRTLDFMTKYYAESVENTKKYLGEEATATTEATGLYKTLADAEKELADAQKALPAKETEVAAAEKTMKDAQALVDAAQLELDKAQAAMDAINEEIVGYRKDVNAAQREIDAANTEKDVATDKKNTATRTKSVAESDKTAAEAAKAAAEAALAAATTNAEKAAAQAELDDANAAIATATATITRADKQIKEAEEAIKAADAIIKTETAKQTAANDKIAAANLKLEDANEVYGAAYRAYDKVSREFNVARGEFNTLNSEVVALKNEIDAAEKKVAGTKDDIENAKENVENNGLYQTLWNEVVAALTPEYQAEVAALAENEAVKAYIEAYKAEEDAQTAYDEIGAKISTLNDLIQNNQFNIYDPVSKISELELKITGLKKNIEELKQVYVAGGYNAETCEQMIAYAKAKIEKLEGMIEVQTEVVTLAKKRVDDYLASQK